MASQNILCYNAGTLDFTPSEFMLQYFYLKSSLLFRLNSGKKKKNPGLNIGRAVLTLSGMSREISSGLSQVCLCKSHFSFPVISFPLTSLGAT